MTDPRIVNLANVLVNYSTKVKPKDWVIIQSSVVALPLANAVAEHVFKAGGYPEIQLRSANLAETSFRFASEEQLQWISPIQKMVIENAQVLINIDATENTRVLNAIDPEKQKIAGVARRPLMKTYMERSATNDLRWVITQFPCDALAQEADMSLHDFEDFVYSATYADQPDPIAEWQRIHNEQQIMVDYFKGKEKIEVRSKNAELTLSVKDRKFINSDGSHNMPSGEVFTSPVEDSANGWIYFTYPAITGGREVEGIRLEFKDGKVVNATAAKNQDFLLKQLDSDESSRFLGEFAIGTNYGIKKFTKSILFDEKIGGSIHLAVGNGFPEAGGKNFSSIHWDMICDMRDESEIYADGELFYKNGKFVA
ncbi:MAG: aminopeptidase [Anaerolineales bacterium]|nr:aminopeptidase [Anaerolineales bacterium]